MGGKYIYAGTINRTPTAANGLPFRCERIAKMLLTDCQNVANGLPKHSKQIATTQHSKNKNHTFEKQKPHYSKVIAKRNINNSQYLEK